MILAVATRVWHPRRSFSKNDRDHSTSHSAQYANERPQNESGTKARENPQSSALNATAGPNPDPDARQAVDSCANGRVRAAK